MPAPSDMTKPSRLASNGLLAVCGVSLEEDIAFIEQKPAKAVGVKGASLPPLIITSARPARIVLKASPKALALAAQAVTIVKFVPFAPVSMEI